IAFMGDDKRSIGFVLCQRLHQTAIARAEAVNSGNVGALIKQLADELFHTRALIEAFQNGQYLAARKVCSHGCCKTIETFQMVAHLQRTGDDRHRPFCSIGKKPEKPCCRASGCTIVYANIMRPCGLTKIGYERDGMDALRA